MSSSRIEQIIEEIEDYIEGCRYQPLSTTKIVVNKEELEELLRELRLKTPDEIKRYQKIIGNKDAILADAQEKADRMIQDAHAQAEKLVSETEIMKQAYGQANETINQANREAQNIVDEAQNDANNIRMSAINYTDQLLSNFSGIVGNAMSDIGNTYRELSEQMQNYYTIVNENRKQLAPMDEANSQSADDSEEFDLSDDE